MGKYTQPTFLLLGYKYSDFTARAKLLLDEHNINYEFQVAPTGIHPDGSGLFGITKVPALINIDDPDLHVANGLDEIEKWLKNHKS